MSELASAEKLRAIVGTSADGSMSYPTIAKFLDEIERGIAELQASWAQEAREHADDSMRLAELAHENAELKREIAEKYMELPVGADGVPIRVGDKVFFRSDGPITVMSIGMSRVYGMNDFGFYGPAGQFFGRGTLGNVRHVKPRTVEDVLRDFLDEKVYTSKTYERYADEIRELMGGDGE